MKNKVQLITYADRLGTGTLASMTDILRTRFDGVYEGVHILPFFTPFDGADAGFDPIDHTAVDPRLGDWDDVAELARTHGIMVDAIVNHMSWESSQFQDVLAKGEESKYFPMFLMMSTVYPDGATEEELAGIYRPRPGLPFTHYTCGGKTRLVWTTFTPQQVDIDTDSEQGWAYLMSIFDRMAASHVSYIRLDAVGYGAKEADSSCFMTPKTFELIGRLREEGAKRGLEILIEVHSYYRKQIEIASRSTACTTSRCRRCSCTACSPATSSPSPTGRPSARTTPSPCSTPMTASASSTSAPTSWTAASRA